MQESCLLHLRVKITAYLQNQIEFLQGFPILHCPLTSSHHIHLSPPTPMPTLTQKM